MEVWLDPDDIGWIRTTGKPMTVYASRVSGTVRALLTVEPSPVEPEETQR